MTSPHDTVLTFLAVDPDGEVVDLKVVRREDVSTTNGAYRCVRDDVADWSKEILSDMLRRYRETGEVTVR